MSGGVLRTSMIERVLIRVTSNPRRVVLLALCLLVLLQVATGNVLADGAAPLLEDGSVPPLEDGNDGTSGP